MFKKKKRKTIDVNIFKKYNFNFMWSASHCKILGILKLFFFFFPWLLQFASCLSSLTLLVGESCRVRYALIRSFAILPRNDAGMKKTSTQAACLTYNQMVPNQLPEHPQEADAREEQASPGNLKDVWPWTVPSTPIPPLQLCLSWLIPQLQRTSGHICGRLDTHRTSASAKLQLPPPTWRWGTDRLRAFLLISK